MAGWIPKRASLIPGIGCVLLTLPAAAQPCAAPRPVHIPIEVVKEPLGMRGETRAEYLNRRYGAGAWQVAAAALMTLAAADDRPESLRLRLPARAGVRFERVDIVAESQLDYLDVQGRPSRRYGHRDIGSYPLAPDASSELAVPVSVMRESGAVLAIVTLRRAPEFAVVEVYVSAVVVNRQGCERRIYVPDRASAIRLNRPRPGQ